MTEAPLSELGGASRLVIAALVGLAVGIEREWSGHASGPTGRFAGLRTFFLLGVLGGGAGLLTIWGYALAGTSLLAGGALLIAAAYLMAVRRPDSSIDGTTEGAALVVLMLGALAGVGELALASGAVALVVLALGEKERLHWFVRRIGEREMRAALQFLVLALVVLPLLPEGPYGPYGGLRPRSLWTIVLVFSGINFAGYIARHSVGAHRGYGVTGLLGGLVSSTAVTLQFSRLSRSESALGPALALGVVGACTVLIPRVVAIATLLRPSVLPALLPYLLPPLVAGVLMIAVVMRRSPAAATTDGELEGQSPLRLWSAIQMAVLFQLSMMAIAAMRDQFGATGVLTTAVALGLTDVDALTVSLTRLADGPGGAVLAAQGIAVGVLANTVFKLMAAVVLGSGGYRKWIAAGLGILAAVLAAALLVGNSGR